MTPPLKCIQPSALFPHRWEVIFVAGWIEEKKTQHNQKDLNPPHSSFNNAILHTRQMQNVNLSRHFLFLWKRLTPIPGRQNKLETTVAAVVRGKRTETRRLYLWHHRCNLQGDFLIPSLQHSGSVEIKGKSIRDGVWEQQEECLICTGMRKYYLISKFAAATAALSRLAGLAARILVEC